MSKTSIQTKADDILAGLAGTKEHDKIRAVRAFCNSDSAFVAWAKKAAFSISAIRNARLIQQAWKRFGAARSLLITIRAIKAVLVKLLANTELAKVGMSEAIDFLKSVRKKSKDPIVVAAVGAALAQQELFAWGAA